MKAANNILLVRIPTSGPEVDGRKLRDYILESLAQGVLVLTEDTTCEVMELPPLGDIAVEQEPQIEDPVGELGMVEIFPSAQAEAEESFEGAEKRAILQRLIDYRAANGRGSLEKVSVKTHHNKAQRISADVLRAILTERCPTSMESWRKIGRALDKLEQESSHAESNHGD